METTTEGTTAAVEQVLDEAQSDLDEARGWATGEQLERVETLDGVLAFFRHFVDAFEERSAVVEGIQTADRQINNEEWESAISTLEDAEQDVGRANSQFEQARAELEAIDSERLDSDTRLDFENLEGNLDELEQLFSAWRRSSRVSARSPKATGARCRSKRVRGGELRRGSHRIRNCEGAAVDGDRDAPAGRRRGATGVPARHLRIHLPG